MSYVVLARKYRPPSFDALVGQEHVVRALSNALTQQRLHHAYLFTGTRGVGKTTISRILAKSLNCTGADGTGGITAHPCGVCDACREIDTGRFIDYVELDAASNRGVDEISQLLDQAVYKPVVGRFKVYMIDEVHMLSTTAFNAMLKTLEEPPDYLKFVLATTDPQKVPATVLSRCLQFNLRPMAPQTVQEHLADVLEREQIPADAGALRLLARAARGSMRDALSLADQAIAFGGGALAEKGVRQMLGAVDRGHAARLVEALAAGDAAALIGSVDALRGLGLSPAGTLEEMAALLQQMAVAQALPGSLDPSDPDAETAARLAPLLAADETQLLYSIVLHGRAELGLAPDDYSGLVMVLLRMLAFKPPGEAQRADAAPAVPASAPTRAPVAAVVDAAPAGDVPPEQPPPPQRPAAVSARPEPSPQRPAALSARPEPPPQRPVALSAPPPEGPAAVPAPPARPAPVSAQPARAAPVTALRVRPPVAEPPPWLDAPDADEAGAPAPMRIDPDDSGGASAAPEPVPAPVQWTDAGERWAALVRRMIDAGSISALVRELAMQAQCLALDEHATPATCRLRVEREMLRAPGLAEKLQAAVGKALGRDVRVETEAGAAADSPARRDAAERDRRQRDAEEIIQNDPLVRALLAQYETARIVPGSVKPH